MPEVDPSATNPNEPSPSWASPTSPTSTELDQALASVPFDVRDRLGEITAPTVVIAGRHDFICGPRWAVLLRDGIPGARLTVLEHSGHFGHIERPAQFTRAITELLPNQS
ncbi:alpha/beta hydrolase [Streptomyces sp. NPDC050264]|uniref:alpha/beta fold hydrolase n=1 Tax=Streptomyces sp. NPDC050264 TaxID=3155038 RepID=UPI00342F5CE2